MPEETVRKRTRRSVSTSIADDTTNNKYQNGSANHEEKVEKVKEIPFYGIKMYV